MTAGFKVLLKNVKYRPSAFSTKYILNDITFNIDPGEIVAIVGSNAAGKSSLLKAIAGELKNIEGDVTIAGQPIKIPVNRVIDQVGIVHQFDDADLVDDLSVAQNICIRKLLGGGYDDKNIFPLNSKWKRKIAAQLGELGVIDPPYIEEPIKNLAGGIKQMLNVAIAIHFEHQKNPCRLLLLDEHTSRLDPINAKKVMEFTIEQTIKNSITTLMVTHKHIDAINYVERVLVMREGKIIKDINKKQNKITLEQLTKYVEGVEN